MTVPGRLTSGLPTIRTRPFTPALPNPRFFVVDLAILTAQTESPQPAELHNSPALFAVLVLPYGFAGAVVATLMPYLLRKNGMPVDQIATIVAIALLPSVWSFFGRLSRIQGSGDVPGYSSPRSAQVLPRPARFSAFTVRSAFLRRCCS